MPTLTSRWLNKPAHLHLGTECDEIGLIRTYRGLFGDVKDAFTPSEIVERYRGFFHYTPSSHQAGEPESPVDVYIFLSNERFANLLTLSVATYSFHHEVHAQLTLEGTAADGFTPISLGGTGFGVSFADADTASALNLFVKDYELSYSGNGSTQS